MVLENYIVPFRLDNNFSSVNSAVVVYKLESQFWQILKSFLLKNVPLVPGAAVVTSFDKRQSAAGCYGSQKCSERL